MKNHKPQLILFSGEKFTAKLVTDTFAQFEVKCHHCGVTPLRAAGSGRRFREDDQGFDADAGCIACGNAIGTLTVIVDTLFGVREDAAVLNGRVRVY